MISQQNEAIRSENHTVMQSVNGEASTDQEQQP